MSDSVDPKPLNIARRQSTIEEFTSYYEKEKERQMNSGDEFDESAYEDARKLILTKLRILEDEGWV